MYERRLGRGRGRGRGRGGGRRWCDHIVSEGTEWESVVAKISSQDDYRDLNVN